MIIKNGLVWEESGSFLTKDLHIDSDTHRIAMDSADTADDTIIDASGLYVIPNILTCSHHTIFSTYACLFYFTCNYSESAYKIQSLVIISESSFRNSSYTSLYLCFHSIF